MSEELSTEPWLNALVGASASVLTAKMAVEHGGMVSADGQLVLLATLVVFAYGVGITLCEVVGEVERLKEAIA